MSCIRGAKSRFSMYDNKRLLKVLSGVVSKYPDIELGKFLRYATSNDELAFLSDKDIADSIEKNFMENLSFEFNETDCLYEDKDSHIGNNEPVGVERLYCFTKENEQIAYERYKLKNKNRKFFDLKETVTYCEFLKNLSPYEWFDRDWDEFNDFYKAYKVINHCCKFWGEFPLKYSWVPFMCILRLGNKYIAFTTAESRDVGVGWFFEALTLDLDLGMRSSHLKDIDLPLFRFPFYYFDEYFAVPLDWCSRFPRFTNYTNIIQYGVRTIPAKKEIEIFNPDQTIEIFHELMQKVSKIIDVWAGVVYDDGSPELSTGVLSKVEQKLEFGF